MPRRNGHRRQNGGRTRNPGRLYRLRWRSFHHGADHPNNEDRAWREAVERLERGKEGAA